MNFLLKIIEGPNKGAEIALVEGVAISLGKGDDCDIVLADPTLPDESMQIEASETGVTIGGEAFEQLHVKTVGATSFAVGPADAPWGALVWPKAEDRAANDPENPETPEETETPEKPETSEKPEKPETPATPAKKRRGCYGCIVALVLLLLVLAVLCWLFREEVRPHAEALWNRISQTSEGQCAEDIQHPTSDVRRVDLAAVVEKYGLLRAEANGTARISGNLKTRRERLAATAEAYEAMPGVELDLTDDESFRAAAEDALFTLTEGALKVVSVTNRVLVISGVSR